MGGLKHLGHRPEDLPVECGVEPDDYRCGNAGVFGVSAVEESPHAPHQRGDLLSRGEFSAGSGHDGAHGLQAGDPWKGSERSQPPAEMLFGAVHPEGLYPDQHLSGAWDRAGKFPDLQSLGTTRGIDDDGVHGGGHHRLLSRTGLPWLASSGLVSRTSG